MPQKPRSLRMHTCSPTIWCDVVKNKVMASNYTEYSWLERWRPSAFMWLKLLFRETLIIPNIQFVMWGSYLVISCCKCRIVFFEKSIKRISLLHTSPLYLFVNFYWTRVRSLSTILTINYQNSKLLPKNDFFIFIGTESDHWQSLSLTGHTVPEQESNISQKKWLL